MPDRVLRDEIWLSERFLDLPNDTCRVAFIRLVNEADDFGNLEGGVKRLYRMLSACTQLKSETATATTLEALIGADLIRTYKVDGRDLIHLPRFRSKRWYFARKVPASPWCDISADLGKTERQAKQRLTKDVDTTLVQRKVNVAQGVGVGVGEGVGKNIETTSLVESADADVAFKVSPCPADKLTALYAKHLPMLPQVTVLNDARKRALSSRWREVCGADKFDLAAGLEWFDWFFAHVRKSSFLIGNGQQRNNGRPWKADFDWLLTPTHFARVVEGRYHQTEAA